MSGMAYRGKARGSLQAEFRRAASLCVAILLATAPAMAGEPDQPSAPRPETLQFRRIFVAEEDMSALELEDVYVPVKRESFETLARSLAATDTPSTNVLQNRLVQATYKVQLTGTERLEGDAELEIAHDGQRESLLSLEPCNLVIREVTWQSDQAAGLLDPSPRPKLGVDDQGRFAFLVPTSGKLQFSWTLRSVSDSSDQPVFPLRLPACPLTRLVLDLPRGVRPVVDHGFASLETEGLGGESSNRWTVDLGGQSVTLLRIVPFQQGDVSAGEVLVRQHTTYRFTPQDVEASFELRLDVLNEPLSQLPLTLDPALELVAITHGEQRLQWTESSEAGSRRVLVEMGEPWIGLNREVVVRALAPVEWGRPWRLPGLSAAEGGWLQGTARLELPGSLVLQKLTMRGCRQIDSLLPKADESDAETIEAGKGAAPLAPVESARPVDEFEVVDLECFEPQAEIETVLQVRPSDLYARSGTSVNLGRSRTSIVQTTDFTTSGPPRFELTLETPLRWTVDLIETKPPAALEDWSLVARNGQARVIQIRLREALAPDQPLRVKVYAHGDGLRGSNRLPGKTLRLAAYAGAVSTNTLFALAADPPNQIRLDGDTELGRVAVEGLSEQDQGLVAISPGSVVYRDGPGADGVLIDLSSDPPDYSAWIDVESELSERKLELLYRIRVQPAAAPIDRLQVHLTEPFSGSLTWNVPGESELPLSAKRLPPEPAAAADAGETWQIVLPEPRDAPFELQASCAVDFDAQASLPLASLPGAATQVGTLTISAEERLPLEIVSQNLRAVQVEPLSPGRYRTTRAVYRYDPSQDSRATVRLAPDSPQGASAWVWTCDLVTRHYHDGKTVHTAEYRLEDCGAQQLKLAMPKAVEWLSATVDGRDVPLRQEAISPTQLMLALPRGVRFPVVQVRYVTHEDSLKPLGTVAAVWPRGDVPVFRRSWVAWLPPGFACVSSAGPAETDSWRRRLFGALLRPPTTAPFAPFSRTSWTSLVGQAREEPRRERPRLESLLAELAERCRQLSQATNQESPLTWGELLGPWEANAEGRRGDSLQIWIDQLALGGLGIFPQTLLQFPEQDAREPAWDAGTLAAVVLAGHHLTLLVDGDRILLTAAERLVDSDAAQRVPGLPNVLLLPAGGSSHWLGQQPDTLRWIRLESWTSRPPLPQVCWQRDGGTSDAERGEILRASGWTVHRMPTRSPTNDRLAVPDRTRVQVFQPQVFQTLGWAALLAAAGLTLWLVRCRLTLAWPLIGMTGIAALLAPWLWVPILQFLFLGTLLGTLLAWIQAARMPRATALAEREELPTTSVVVQGLAMLAVLAFLLGGSAFARGAEPAANSGEIFQVVSPIDKDNQPSGDYVYVPRGFYYAMREKASGQRGSPQQWMIYEATYQAVMHWNEAEEQLSVVELAATYELEVFPSSAVIRLPMVETQAHLLPNRALLDGRPATVSWLADRGGLALEIDSPGSHRVELAFRPQILRDGARDRFELAVPRVANSVLRTELPAEIKDLDFPTALGTKEMDHQAGNWVVYLGPADRLAVSWPVDAEMGLMPESLESEQLMWLRVGQDALHLDTRFRFSNLRAPIDQVNLLADPHLRLLPPPDESPVAWYESTEGPAQTIHLAFEPPYQQDLEFDLAFRLDGTASVGHLRVPQLTSSADRTNRVWLAVTIDPALVCEFTPVDGAPAPSPADFAAAWGATETLPTFVLDLARANVPASLPIRPREPRAVARQRSEIACGPESADLLLTADIQPVEGFRLQYEVALPESVHVHDVTVEELGQERLRRWSRDAQGRLILRLKQALRQDHRIQIHGRLDTKTATRPPAALPLPDWNIVGVDRESWHVDIYRRDQVQIKNLRPIGFAPAPGFRAGLFRPGWGRWVASLDAEPGEAVNRVEIVPVANRPQTTGQMVITVRRETDSWWAEADFDLSVSGGVLDVLRLEIPADWKGPHDVPPGTAITLSEFPGQGRRYLLLRPEQAASGPFQLRLRGPISAAPGERIRVPDIVPLNLDRVNSYVTLPARVDQQRIVWERSGLQAQPLPERFRSREGPAAVSYETRRPRFRATIKDIQMESGVASVRLADHCVDLAVDGRLVGVSTFDLEPAGRSECRLVMPDGYRLLHLTVAELPVLPLPGEADQLRVPLGPQQLPQRIQALFVGHLSGDAGDASPLPLQAPRLLGLPVEHTCWTVRRPADSPWEPVPGPSAADPAGLDWLRARSIARSTAKAEDVLKDGDPDEIIRWYVPWARRWVAACSRLAQGSLGAETGPADAQQELAEIDKDQRRIAQRLGVEAQLLAAEQESKRTSDLADVWRIAGTPHSVTTGLITSGKTEFPQVRRLQRPQPLGDQRIAAAGMLGGLVLIVLFFLPHPALDDLLRRYPEILAVVLGASWWWAFAASAVGCLVFFAGLLGLLLNAARRRIRRLSVRSL